MGIAALILGILALLVAFIPVFGFIAFFPAIAGLVLGIVDVVNKSKKNESKGTSIAGIILNSIAIVVMIVWIFVLPFLIAGMGNQMLDDGAKQVMDIQKQL